MISFFSFTKEISKVAFLLKIIRKTQKQSAVEINFFSKKKTVILGAEKWEIQK
jgi:hypothetical protein